MLLTSFSLFVFWFRCSVLIFCVHENWKLKKLWKPYESLLILFVSRNNLLEFWKELLLFSKYSNFYFYLFIAALVSEKFPSVSETSSTSMTTKESTSLVRKEETVCTMPEELLVPGTLYYLKRNLEGNGNGDKGREFFTLWRRNPGEHFQRVPLSSNLISDHKCESHYLALRDVLKGFSGHMTETIFWALIPCWAFL